MLSPIVSAISEIKNVIKHHSELQNLHNEALHQTQLVVIDSASWIKHLRKQSIPCLKKILGNMSIDSVNHNNKQILGLKTDINQRFDTQIHILDDLTKMINLDQQNLRDLIKSRNIQDQVGMKMVTTELEQAETRVGTSLCSFGASLT